MKLRLKTGGFLPTCLPNLDEALERGFRYGTLSHIYGNDGSGKTTLAMQFAIATLKLGHEVFWVDMNNSFNLARFVQVNHMSTRELSKLKLKALESYSEYKDLINKFDGYISRKTKLVVIDNVTYFYRLNLNKNTKFRLRRDLYAVQLPILARIVLDHDLHVMLTNQVRGDFKKNFAAIGENEINKYCKYEISLENGGQPENLRKMVVKKALNKQLEVIFAYKIDKHGFCGVEKC